MQTAGADTPPGAQAAVIAVDVRAQLAIARNAILLPVGVEAAVTGGGRDVARLRDMPRPLADGVTPHLYPHPMTSDRE